MSIHDSVEEIAERHGPCIVLAAQLAGGDEDLMRARLTFEESLEGVSSEEVATALACLKFGLSIIVERFADAMGVPENRMHALINERMNAFTMRDAEE